MNSFSGCGIWSDVARSMVPTLRLCNPSAGKLSEARVMPAQNVCKLPDDLFEVVAEGAVKVLISRRFALEQIRDAS